MRRCLVALAAVCACSGPSTPVPGPAPAVPQAEPSLRHPQEERLANVVQLTRDAGENAEAYWSFGGDELVFQSSREPYGCDQIYRVKAEQGASPQLVSTGEGRTTCAYFSHDDKRIVYASTHHVDKACPAPPDMSQGYVWPLYESYDIFSALADGGDLKQLTKEPGYDAEATVCSVDGSIIFTSTRDGDLELYRMDADGSNVQRLTHTPGYDGGAFFSADCKQIVWRASRPTGTALEDYKRLLSKGLVRPGALELFVADADGTDVRQVTYLGAASFAPFMHPSGRSILFSSNHPEPRGREFNIWRVEVDGSGLEQVTFAPGFDGFPMFSPDGKRLAFASNRGQAKKGQTDVYVADWREDVDAAARQTDDVDRVRSDVRWLSDDAREGRGVGTRGLEKSAQWLEERMQRLGLAPGFGSSYRQRFEVPVSVRAGPKTRLIVGKKEVASASFVAAGVSASGTATGKLVSVGYGIVSEEAKHDDYKGKNVRGKIAVIHRFVPSSKYFSDTAKSRRYSDIHYKAFLARERGAKAVLLVDSAGAAAGREAALPTLRYAKQGNVGIPVAIVKSAALGKLKSRRQPATVTVELVQQSKKVDNIVGVIRGSKKGAGAVVVGAHYDHLGFGDDSSREPGKRAVHNGADDNASGTAALLEVARTLSSAGRLERDVYVVAFTAEELGVLGAGHFVRNLPSTLSKEEIVAMVNMDMVGRMRANSVTVLGGKTALEWSKMVDEACVRASIRCQVGGSGYGPSDQTAFYAEGVPVLHFFTGSHSDYHKTSDDAAAINSAGIARIARAVSGVLSSLASSPARLSFQRVAAPLPPGDSRGFGASLGTIPDYTPDDGSRGMLLSGVRPGGPAEKAGMRKGDRLVQLGGKRIRTVRDLVHVLRNAKSGQLTRAVMTRKGERLVLQVTYGDARPRR